MSIPNKGDIIINPQTQRPVKVGSRTWLKLVKAGAVKGQYRDPAVLEENGYELADDGSNIEERKIQLNATLPKGKHAVKGRGRHKGKIVVRHKRLAPKDVAKFTTKASASAMANNMDELENLDDDEIEAKLEELILREMMREQRTNKAPAIKGGGRKKKVVQEELYELDEQASAITSQEDEAPDNLQWHSSQDDDDDYDHKIDGFDDSVFDTDLQW